MSGITRKNPGSLFSAAALGAMALALAGLVVPATAGAADRQNERGLSGVFAERAEQARARASERASSRAWRNEARPAAVERAQPRAAERAQSQMRGRWSRGDADRLRAEAARERVQGSAPDRAPREVRNDDRRERSWSGSRTPGQVRDGSAWRQDRRDDARQDRRESYRNDRRDDWRRDGRENWRGDRAENWRDNRRDNWRSDRQGDWRRDSDRDRSAWRDRDDRRWDRNHWRRDHRYDWQSYRDRHRSIYRTGRYYVPYHGYSYRRLSIGFGLSPLFYSSRYWIDDPWYYRLPPVYGPYRWVRYFDDALLVNIHSGEVVDVIHDFFW